MPEVYSAEKSVGKEKNASSRKAEVYKQLKKERTHNPLAAFAIAPPKMKFETQEEGEKIVLLLRQHPVVNVGWIVIAGLMLLAPGFLGVINLLDFMPERFAAMTVLLWYLLTLAFVVERFLDWYFNVYIVTDERVVDIDFYGLIYRDLSVTKIDKIQDINFIQSGAVASLFNYGDIFIQTASEKREFDFMSVPRPARVVEILYQMMEEEEREALEGRVK